MKVYLEQNMVWKTIFTFFKVFCTYDFNLRSDICTSNWWQLWQQPCFSLFLLVKNNGEKKWKRGDKNVIWAWERKLSKNCHKMVVQISFLWWLCKYDFSFNIYSVIVNLKFGYNVESFWIIWFKSWNVWFETFSFIWFESFFV